MLQLLPGGYFVNSRYQKPPAYFFGSADPQRGSFFGPFFCARLLPIIHIGVIFSEDTSKHCKTLEHASKYIPCDPSSRHTVTRPLGQIGLPSNHSRRNRSWTVNGVALTESSETVVRSVYAGNIKKPSVRSAVTSPQGTKCAQGAPTKRTNSGGNRRPTSASSTQMTNRHTLSSEKNASWKPSTTPTELSKSYLKDSSCRSKPYGDLTAKNQKSNTKKPLSRYTPKALPVGLTPVGGATHFGPQAIRPPCWRLSCGPWGPYFFNREAQWSLS